MKTTKKEGEKNNNISMSISWNSITIPIFNGVTDGMGESVLETSFVNEPSEYVEPEIYGKSTPEIEIKQQYNNKWAVYDAAQTQEIRLFDELLKDLVETISKPVQEIGKGRPRIPIDELVFCAVKKVYSKLSSRRAQGLFDDAVEHGYINNTPHFNTMSSFLNDPETTTILRKLIELSAIPLAGIESDFAIDSTGFRTSSFGEYCRVKHKTTQKHRWLKAHIITGVKTNVVAAITITKDYSGDSLQFKELVHQTANRFDIKEVSADKAYSSRANFEIVGDVGGQAYIPFKKNATARAGGSPLWKKAFHMFQLHREEFDKHYHKRSNAESTIFAIKQKFGEILTSKNRVSQENELLCKVLAYNITVLIHEMFENGIDPNFILHKKSDN